MIIQVKPGCGRVDIPRRFRDIELYAWKNYEFEVVDIRNEHVDDGDSRTASVLCVYISPNLDAYEDVYDLETALHIFSREIRKIAEGEPEYED